MMFDLERTYGGYNRVIASLIESGKTVLDVGCSTGALGEALARQRNATVDGIEADPASAAAAQAHYRRVIVADVESLIPANTELGTYDAIVFADVLEHLRRPDTVLKRFAQCLNPGGSVYISVPNVAFFPIRLLLLAGRFPYGGRLMDPTHLRFFTRHSLAQLISQSGLSPDYIQGYFDSKRARFFFSVLARCMPGLFAFTLIAKARSVVGGGRRENAIRH